MAQYARPSTDTETNGWVTQAGSASNLFDAINEATADDADYVRISSPHGEVLKVDLSLVADPQSAAGHVVRYRIGKSGAAAVNFLVSLRQGGTEIASWTHYDVGTTLTTQTQTLTTDQANAITDYGDLELRIAASGGWVPGMDARTNYVGFVGDSLTVAGGDMLGTVRLWNTSGSVGSFGTWACVLPTTDTLGVSGKMVWAGCSALSGSSIATIRTTYWPPMRDATPRRGFVVFLAGTNDLGSISPSGVVSSPALATRMADLTAMWDEAIAQGQIPVACAVPPSSTANNRPAVIALRDAIATAAAARGIPYANLYAPVGNANTGDWGSATYHAGDGIHFSTAGAILAGQALRDAIEPFLLDAPWPRLVTSGDDTTGWEFLGGRFTADPNANGRPDGGFQGIVTDVWQASTNTSTLSLVAASGGDVDGNWLKVAKTGSITLASQSTMLGTGSAPLPATTADLYEVAFRFKWATWSATVGDLGYTFELADVNAPSNKALQFTAYGQGASGGPYTLSALTRTPPTTNNYRVIYGIATRNAGGTGDVFLGQLSVKQIV